MDRLRDTRAMLELTPVASAAWIKYAHRKRVGQNHPDKTG
jgi:curved DNA-binding protein CbpA